MPGPNKPDPKDLINRNKQETTKSAPQVTRVMQDLPNTISAEEYWKRKQKNSDAGKNLAGENPEPVKESGTVEKGTGFSSGEQVYMKMLMNKIKKLEEDVEKTPEITEKIKEITTELNKFRAEIEAEKTAEAAKKVQAMAAPVTPKNERSIAKPTGSWNTPDGWGSAEEILGKQQKRREALEEQNRLKSLEAGGSTSNIKRSVIENVKPEFSQKVSAGNSPIKELQGDVKNKTQTEMAGTVQEKTFGSEKSRSEMSQGSKISGQQPVEDGGKNKQEIERPKPRF